MGIVAFSYQTWAARYPALAGKVAEPLAQAYFEEAGMPALCPNTDTSAISDLKIRALILNMTVAHIAALELRALDAPIVGRINSATEGSVTVQAQIDLPPGSAQWWAQTPYGMQAWMAMAPYRGMQYRPGRQPYQGPYIGGYVRRG
jgi:hypothetical protein